MYRCTKYFKHLNFALWCLIEIFPRIDRLLEQSNSEFPSGDSWMGVSRTRATRILSYSIVDIVQSSAPQFGRYVRDAIRLQVTPSGRHELSLANYIVVDWTRQLNQLIVSSTWENQLCTSMDKLSEEELVIPSIKYECKFARVSGNRCRSFLLKIFAANRILSASLRHEYSNCLITSSGLDATCVKFRDFIQPAQSSALKIFTNRYSLLQISITPRTCSKYQSSAVTVIADIGIRFVGYHR